MNIVDHNNHHVMVDIETLSTAPNAAITTIGAVAFNGHGIGSTFYTVIGAQATGHRSPETLEWLNKPDNKPALDVASDPGISPATALRDLAAFIGNERFMASNDFYLWANTPKFDMTILESAYQNTGITVPWHFHELMCFKTAVRLAGLTRHQPEQPHHALHDAIAQAKTLMPLLSGGTHHQPEQLHQALHDAIARTETLMPG